MSTSFPSGFGVSGDALYVDRLTMAKRLSISVRKLDDLRKRGILPSLKLGGRRLYDPRAVHDAMSRLTESG